MLDFPLYERNAFEVMEFYHQQNTAENRNKIFKITLKLFPTYSEITISNVPTLIFNEIRSVSLLKFTKIL